MVRLRSNRWYAADGQHNRRKRVSQQTSGTRRVLSLCLLLALVIVLMQQASDPRNVQQAFQTLGVPLDPPSGFQLADSNASTQANASPTGSSKWSATCADVIPRILDSLTTEQQNVLATFWFARTESDTVGDSLDKLEESSTNTNQVNLPSESVEWGADVIGKLIEQTAQSPMAADEKTQWLAELEQFSSQWQAICTTPATEAISMSVSQELRQALTAALDKRLVASLRDASPWTQSESLAFWRLLQRTTATASHSIKSENFVAAPRISTRQLDAEAGSLRGQPVRFRGQVHRAQRVEREFAPLHMSGGYWVLWLRGEDEAIQPVAIYTTDPIAAELAVQIDQSDSDYPPLEVHAIFAKRLAYASEDGLQVGPALMANRLIPLRSPAPPLPVVTPQPLRNQFTFAVVAACLLAAALLLPIVWGSRRRVKRHHRTEIGLLLFVTAVCWQANHSTHGRFAWAAPPMASAGSAVVGEAEAPPWAQSNTNPLTEFLTRGGQIPLTAADANELRVALHDHSAAFPNALLKVFNSVGRVGWIHSLDASQQPSTKVIELGEGLQLQRRLVVGWVRAAIPVRLSESQRDWFQVDDRARLYQVELQVQATDSAEDTSEDSARAAQAELLTIYCERVPQVWLSSARLRQPAQFAALALVDQAAAGTPTLCGLAEAPQWLLPNNLSNKQLVARLAPPLAPYVLELGQLGWDLTHLDTIAQHNQKPLSRDEAAGFYSLLRLANAELESGKLAGQVGVGNADSAGDRRATLASQPLALLADAKSSVGRPLEWSVRVVTGTLVPVADAADQRQLGGKAYIQFDGFVDIGNDRIRFQPVGGPEPAPKLDFSGEFPVTIVAGLSEQLLNSPLVPAKQLAAGQQSWAVGQYARLRGRFYRLWSYQSELVQSSTPQGRQVAPLVVASSLLPTAPPERDQSSYVGWFGWALCGAMLVILGAILWLASRPRRQK
ncbi:MAG: hypothetical protein R3C56_42175 [Pirellulaceae bacterium]